MKLKPILSILLAAGISAAFFGCAKDLQESPASGTNEDASSIVALSLESVKSIHLETVAAEEKSLTGEIVCPAELVTDPDREALVGSYVQGRVHKVMVRLGDYVRKGQEIMLIEGLEVGEIKAQFIKAKAQLEFAEAAYNRSRNLLEQKAGSQKNFLEAQAEYHKALAEFNAEDKKIHSIGLKDEEAMAFSDDKTHTGGMLSIKSPIEGVIVERNVVIGQQVDASTNAFRIVNTSALFADGQLNEKDASLISGKGSGDEITLVLSSLPEEYCKGRISYIGEIIDEKTRTLKVRASIQNTKRRLKPEMFGEMRIPYSAGAKAVVLPAESLVKDNNETFVFVAKSDTSFEKRPVELFSARNNNNQVQISKGLKPGEKIVSKGAFLLKSELFKDRLGEGE